MTIANVADLVDILSSTQLLNPTQVEALVQHLQPRFPEPRDLAGELMRRGWLSAFQINLLFQDRNRELVLGPYVLLDRLGEGGMGQVFKARHQLMNRVVAVKLIRKERLASPDAVRRFIREVQAVGQLSHPNIVIAHDAAQVGDTHYFVMEYVDGVDLAQVVKARGALPIGEACEYIRQAALGLSHAHEHGMVHRDIKPANLLLTNRTGVVKLLDMGLARLQAGVDPDDPTSHLTQAGSVMGTPDYIAPEQALDSHTVDIRSDIYSLGCSLYFLLTGQVPFPGGTLGEKLVKHQLKEPQPVERLRPDMPPSLSAVVRKLMAKRADDRFQTPAEVALALEPFARPASGTLAVVPGGAFAREAGQPTPTPLPTVPVFPMAQPAAPVPVILDQTIDPTAPLALPVARPVQRATVATEWWAAVRRHPWWVGLAGGALLLILVAGTVLFLRPAPAVRSPADIDTAPTVLGGQQGRHGDKVVCVAYSPDGRWAASGGADQVVRLWDAATLEPRGVLKGHTGPVQGLAFSPDSQLLVSGGQDGTLRLWNLADVTREPGRLVQEGTPQPVSAVTFALDGQRLVSGHANGTVHLWAVANRREVKSLQPGGNGLIAALACSRDGRQVLAGGNGESFWLLDAKSGEVVRTYAGHKGGTHFLAFLSGGHQVVSSGADLTLATWAKDPKEPVRRRKLPPPATQCLAVSADGREVVLAGPENRVLLWHVNGDRPMADLPGHSAPLTAAAIGADGRRALTASADFTLRLWDLPSGKDLTPRDGHSQWVQSIAFAPDGHTLASAGADLKVRLWEVAKHTCQRTLPEAYGPVPCLAFSPHGQKLFICNNGQSMAVVEMATGRLLLNPSLNWGNNMVMVTMTPFPAGEQFFSCVGQRYAVGWSGTNARLTTPSLGQHARTVVCGAVAPDGRRVLTGGADWDIQLVDVQTGTPRRRLVGHTDEVLAVTFSPDGKEAFSVGADKAVWRWDLEGKGRRKLWQMPREKDAESGKELDPLTTVAFSPGVQLLAAMSDHQGKITVWEVATGKRLREWPIFGAVHQLAFAPDGRLLASANQNGTISLYPVAP